MWEDDFSNLDPSWSAPGGGSGGVYSWESSQDPQPASCTPELMPHFTEEDGENEAKVSKDRRSTQSAAAQQANERMGQP